MLLLLLNRPESQTAGSPAPLLILSSLLRPSVNTTLPAAVGSFTLTGGTANLLRGRRLSCAAGSFAVSGQAATLSYVPNVSAGGGNASPLLILGSLFTVDTRLATGSFTLTGTSAALKVGRRLVADTQSFALSGIAATLTKGALAGGGNPAPLTILGSLLSGSSSNKYLPSSTGTFALTGTAATLSKGRILTAATGSFILAGAPAEVDVQLTAAGTAFTLTGVAAALKKGRLPLTASAGAFVLSGKDAFLVKQSGSTKILGAGAGAFTLTGIAAGFKRGYVLSAATGYFTLTGQPADYSGKAPVTQLPSGGRRKPKQPHKPVATEKPIRLAPSREAEIRQAVQNGLQRPIAAPDVPQVDPEIERLTAALRRAVSAAQGESSRANAAQAELARVSEYANQLLAHVQQQATQANDDEEADLLYVLTAIADL